MEQISDSISRARSRTPSTGQNVIDVRAIANLVLDRADDLQFGISNMALNKIVYFVHCDFLLEKGSPLVGAKIEAWQHGPVFRELYQEFKKWDDSPIKSRANKVSPFTGELEVAEVTFGTDERIQVLELIDRYVRFSASYLRALSHVDGGPWDKVWQHSGKANPGMQISNDLIKSTYQAEVRQ